MTLYEGSGSVLAHTVSLHDKEVELLVTALRALAEATREEGLRMQLTSEESGTQRYAKLTEAGRIARRAADLEQLVQS